jgi:hypothetical protein
MDRSLAISFISFGASLTARIISWIPMDTVAPAMATPVMLAITDNGSILTMQRT